jgi:hypothetical protein
MKTNQDYINDFKRRTEPKDQIDTLLYSNEDGKLIDYPDGEYEIDREKVILFLSEALEEKECEHHYLPSITEEIEGRGPLEAGTTVIILRQVYCAKCLNKMDI